MSGARFVSERAMWKYMTNNSGKHKHKYKDKDVYVNEAGKHVRTNTGLR